MSDCTKEAMAEAIAKMEQAEQVRKAKREEMMRLTMKLLTFDNECLGAAVKCYISENADPEQLPDATFEAYTIIAKIKVLEWEC